MFARLSFVRPRVPSLFFDSRRALAALHERFAEAQRALAHVQADFVVPCPTAFLSGWSADAYRAQFSGAWHQAQDRLRGFEHNLRTAYQTTVKAHPPSPYAPMRFAREAVTQVLLPLWVAHYCDQAARYTSAGREGAPPPPLEWLQMAALVAIVQVVQTVVMLAVLSQASAAPHPTRLAVWRRRVVTTRRAPHTSRTIPLPLRL